MVSSLIYIILYTSDKHSCDFLAKYDANQTTWWPCDTYDRNRYCNFKTGNWIAVINKA